jgi:hypothetical protein
MPSALLFELDDEWKERVCVVCMCKSVSVEKASICADGTDHSDRLTSCIGELNSHSFFQSHS